MKNNNVPPALFSAAFHLQFFPGLIKSRISPNEGSRDTSGRGTSFSSVTEHMVLLIISGISFITGMAGAVNSGSLTGWFFGIAGLCGILVLLVMSIAGSWGEEPSYDNFRFFTFIFLILLCLACGLGLGQTLHSPYVVRILCGTAGIIVGYFIGIICGLWIQRLGWISTMLDYLAGLGAIGLVIIDIIMLL